MSCGVQVSIKDIGLCVCVCTWLLLLVSVLATGGAERERDCRVAAEISVSGVKLHPREADPGSAFASSTVTLLQLKPQGRDLQNVGGTWLKIFLRLQATTGWKRPRGGCLTARKPSFKARVAPAQPFQCGRVLHTVKLT